MVGSVFKNVSVIFVKAYRFEFKVFFLFWRPYKFKQETSLPNYLLIAGLERRWILCLFSRDEVRIETQTGLFRIWTHFAKFISNDDNRDAS